MPVVWAEDAGGVSPVRVVGTAPEVRIALADWFGSPDEVPDACEVCDSGDPVFTVWDGAECLGICRTCALGDMVERWLLAWAPEPAYCACGVELLTPYERRKDKCYECERMDERMRCCVCEKFVGMAYGDGRPTFCSDACEAAYDDAPEP